MLLLYIQGLVLKITGTMSNTHDAMTKPYTLGHRLGVPSPHIFKISQLAVTSRIHSTSRCGNCRGKTHALLALSLSPSCIDIMLMKHDINWASKLVIVLLCALSYGVYSFSATKPDALEPLTISPELRGVPGNSFVDDEGSVYTGFWYPENEGAPYVAKVTSDLSVAWIREFQINVESPEAAGAPVIVMRNERQPYVILPLAPYRNISKPAGRQLVSGGSFSVFSVDSVTAAFIEPAFVLELAEPVTSIDNAAPGPRCVYSGEFAGDIIYCSLLDVADGNARLWKIEMFAEGIGKVLWERRPGTRNGFELYKSVAIAEDEAAESLVVGFAGATSAPIPGVEEIPSGETVIGIEVYNRDGARTTQSFLKANDARSHVNAMAIGSEGLIVLAEAPVMLHRIGLREVEGAGGKTLTKVWSASNVNDHIVAIEIQNETRVVVAGSTIRLEAGQEGSGDPVSIESPVVAVYNMSGAERFREVHTMSALGGNTLRLSSVSLLNETSGDAVVLGHWTGIEASAAFLGAFRARTEAEIERLVAPTDLPSPTPGSEEGPESAAESEDRNMKATSNRSFGVAMGVGIGVLSLVILAVLAVLAKKQLSTRASPEYEEEGRDDVLEQGQAPVAKNTLA